MWTGSPVEVVTRALVAVSILSLEMQLATWTGVATLRSLVYLNVPIAFILAVLMRRRMFDPGPPSAIREPYVWSALAGLGALVLGLNLALPLEGADPYHMQRIERIVGTGTLEYDPSADSKLNVLGWFYELVMADVASLPIVGPAVVKLHGVVWLAAYAVTVAAVVQLLGGSSWLAWLGMLTIPVVFHQLVLVKNDLLGAMPAVLVLTWLIVHSREALPIEIAWAAWLAGIAVGVKLPSVPLVVVVAAVVLAEHVRDAARIAAAVAGGLAGAIAGGLLFTLVENARVYGDPIDPLRGLGNLNTSLTAVAVSTWRFFISLFDMGILTRAWWPGRGGWAGTYGLPAIWALGVLLALARQRGMARRTLLVSGTYWVTFAALYPDADVAHRLALAPGMLVVAVAAVLADDVTVRPWARAAGLAAFGASAVQILRSAMLYIQRV